MIKSTALKRISSFRSEISIISIAFCIFYDAKNPKYLTDNLFTSKSNISSQTGLRKSQYSELPKNY